jgi:hypothetical protein
VQIIGGKVARQDKGVDEGISS